MKYDYLFIDFDETLFNHFSYFDWLDKIVPDQERSTSFRQSADGFHEDKGENMRLYDHNAHIEHVTGESWELMSAEFQKLIKEKTQDFCFKESHEFIRRVDNLDNDVRILTYGNADYQRFKINTCPVLRELYIPVHVVREAKHMFLANNFKSGKGVIIDDKYPLSLPSNWHHIWIDRKSKFDTPQKIDKNVTKVSSLRQVIEIII